MLELALRIFEEIVHFWEFFIVSTIAIVGWIFSRNSAWSDLQRGSICLAFLVGVAFNLIGLIRSYMALNIVISELKHHPDIPEITPRTTRAIINRFSMGYWWIIGIFWHLVIDLIVVYLILILSGQSLDG
jgi:hypothetical protein